MATGTYTSPKRVVKDGILIAFKGQEFPMDKAVSLGLTTSKATEAQAKKEADELAAKEAAESKAKAEKEEAEAHAKKDKKK